MNERRDERWLDEQLRRAINMTAPEFDAEMWKRDHAGAYQALVSRGRRVRRVHWAAGGLAAAAVVLIGAAILLTRTPSQIQQEPVGGDIVKAPSPAHIVSMMSLRASYRQGGEEALYEQLDTAMKTLGPRPGRLSSLKMFGDLDG
jgi:hypothetical protein